MYFILSKVLLFLILPINWVAAFLLVALFAKRPKLKKRCLITGVVLLAVFSNHYLFYLFAKNYESDVAPLNKNKVYSAAIVLGGFTGEGANGKGFFGEESDRFIQGIKLKTAGRVSHILISGGNGGLRRDTFTEGGWVRGQLKDLKFPDSVILIEEASRNTIENAAFSRTILQKAHLQPPYVLITSRWHMRRATYIFKKEGLDVVPYLSGNPTSNMAVFFTDAFTFDSYTLSQWDLYTKEVVGMVVTYFKYAF